MVYIAHTICLQALNVEAKQRNIVASHLLLTRVCIYIYIYTHIITLL